MKRFAWPLAALALAPAGALAQAPPAARPDVVVTGQRPKVQTLIDRKVYTVTGDVQATTSSAADVLNTIPSVNVDVDGTVSLRGDTNVTILVDGKPAAQLSGAAQGLSLLQFPASEIDRIEVLTHPPAQYGAEGSGGVINIITRKSRKAGLSGTARASVGDHGRFVLGVDGTWRAGPLKLTGGIGLRQDIRERLTTDGRLVTDPAPAAASAERIDERFRRLTPSVSGGVNYDFNARQSAGASFSVRDLTGHRVFAQSDGSGPPAAAPASIADRHSDGHELHVEASLGAHFLERLRRPDETLAFTLQRSLVHERERYEYTDTFPLPAAPVAFSDLHLGLDLIKTEFSADYDLPASDDRDLKLGYDLQADDNDFDNRGDVIDPATGARTLDPTVTNRFHYRQQIDALYGEYQGPLGRWRLAAGLRIEAARASWRLITGDIPGGRSDFGVYPSLSLERPVGTGGKITASLSRRITRPDPEALNPFADHQDTHNLRAGNPALRPQDTWSYELGYAASGGPLTWGASAYYRTDRDSVTDIVQPVSADVVLITKTNLPESRSAGLDFDLGGKLGRSLSFTLAGNLFYAEIDARLLGASGLRSTTGLDAKASLDWRPSPRDTLQVSFSRSDARLTPQGRIGAIDLVNLGYRRELRPGLTFVATLSDALDGQRFTRTVTAPGLHDTYLRHQIGRIAFVGLVYTFGAPAKAKTNGFDYDQ